MHTDSTQFGQCDLCQRAIREFLTSFRETDIERCNDTQRNPITPLLHRFKITKNT